jgi:hypothetical protein
MRSATIKVINYNVFFCWSKKKHGNKIQNERNRCRVGESIWYGKAKYLYTQIIYMMAEMECLLSCKVFMDNRSVWDEMDFCRSSCSYMSC